VTIDHVKCVPCQLCRKACAFGGIQHSLLEGLVVKCDHCAGDPECVKHCASGALEYVDVSGVADALGGREDLASPGLSACLGCPLETLLRFTLRFFGRDTILALGPSCAAGIGSAGFGATNGLKIPTYHSLLDNYASMLSGTRRAYRRVGKEFHAVVLAGDGGTADVGFQSLSGAAERGENLIYICYDNEGYMNTGIQRSGTTPRGAWTTTTPVGAAKRGKTQQRKDMALLMAMHDIPYVATANIGYPADYLAKLRLASQVKHGLAYLHVFSSCPTGWRFPPERSIQVNKMAVQTNFAPLWECLDGRFRLTKEVPFPRPIEAYTRLMGKYAHLTRAEIDEFQADVDRRYRRLQALARM
jgi:phenylglyoxylate dehydrogenase beta subunit